MSPPRTNYSRIAILPNSFLISLTIVVSLNIFPPSIGSANSEPHWVTSSGMFQDLDRYSAPQQFKLPKGYHAIDIVGMAAGTGNYIYTWYKRDNKCTYSKGLATDLGLYGVYSCQLPTGYSLNDILGIGILSDNRVVTYYKTLKPAKRDPKMSIGTRGNLSYYQAPSSFHIPASILKEYHIVGIGVDKSSDTTRTLYMNGNIRHYSEGTLTDLGHYRSPTEIPATHWPANWTPGRFGTWVLGLAVTTQGEIRTIYTRRWGKYATNLALNMWMRQGSGLSSQKIVQYIYFCTPDNKDCKRIEIHLTPFGPQSGGKYHQYYGSVYLAGSDAMAGLHNLPAPNARRYWDLMFLENGENTILNIRELRLRIWYSEDGARDYPTFNRSDTHWSLNPQIALERDVWLNKAGRILSSSILDSYAGRFNHFNEYVKHQKNQNSFNIINYDFSPDSPCGRKLRDLGKSGSDSNDKYGYVDGGGCDESVSWYYNEAHDDYDWYGVGYMIQPAGGPGGLWRKFYNRDHAYDWDEKDRRFEFCPHSDQPNYTCPNVANIEYIPKSNDYLYRSTNGRHSSLICAWVEDKNGQKGAFTLDDLAPVKITHRKVELDEQNYKKRYHLGRISDW